MALRVALVHPFSWPEVRRGGERYLDDLACHLAAGGHLVEVITGGSGGAESEANGVLTRRFRHLDHPRLRRRGIGPVETFGVRALRVLARRRYDVVHALTPTAALAGRATGHRTVYSVLGQPDAGHFRDHPNERRLTAAAVRTATEVAVLSRSAAAVQERVFGRTPAVLPPGVRSERFPPRLAPRSGPPRILFPADASDRRKGVDLALGAMAVVLDRHPDARLVLGGPGDHGWAVDSLGADADRVLDATDVVGVGDLGEVPARYRDATVTVLPSVGEAFGLAVVESLASGTPAVCLPGSGPEEILDDDRVGKVSAGATAEALGAALVEAVALAADPATPPACTAHARQWDWDSSVGPAHVELYERLVRS